MTQTFLLYGATGYTGRLAAYAAVRQGLRPILAGRSPGRVAALARALDLDWRAFPLTDAAALDGALRGMPAVLHCAGPYSQTYPPMVDACLRTGVHYLDISGDLAEHEALAGHDAEAAAAGVMLLPSVGFDVVPSDCLAAHLKRRLPTATHLALAFQSFGGVSRGSLISTIDTIDRPGMVRQDGVLTPVPAAWRTRRIDFGAGAVTVVTLPWGDLATAYRSTGIPHIETYMALPAGQRLAMKSARVLGPLLGSRPGKALLMRLAAGIPEGPSEAALLGGYSLLWGEAQDDAGRRAVSRMRTPHAYAFTAETAVAVIDRVLAGDAHPGYQSPASAYGPDFVLTLPGVTRWDDPLTPTDGHP